MRTGDPRRHRTGNLWLAQQSWPKAYRLRVGNRFELGFQAPIASCLDGQMGDDHARFEDLWRPVRDRQHLPWGQRHAAADTVATGLVVEKAFMI
ncbi:hypothetical protein D3C81_1893890 [compost metagenome]